MSTDRLRLALSPIERERLACMPQMWRYSRGLLYAPESADDLVQDTLERAWLKLPQWQADRGGLLAWAFSIMHTLLVDRLRSRRGRLEDNRGAEQGPFGAGAARAKQSLTFMFDGTLTLPHPAPAATAAAPAPSRFR